MAHKLNDLKALTPTSDEVIEVAPADATTGMPAIHADAQELRRMVLRRKVAAIMALGATKRPATPKTATPKK